MSGKGSAPRPFEVDYKTFSSNWEAIFGQKNKQVDVPPQTSDNSVNEETPAKQEEAS